jgi:hypothetical protein
LRFFGVIRAFALFSAVTKAFKPFPDIAEVFFVMIATWVDGGGEGEDDGC